MRRVGRPIERMIGTVLLGLLIAACSTTDNSSDKRVAQPTPPVAPVPAASPDEGSASVGDGGEVASRRVLPSDPCLSSADINCRNRINQLKDVRRELANPTAPPTIPPVPANGGRCVVDVQGQYGPPVGQPGARGSYRHFEVQLWIVTSMPIPGQSATRRSYAVQWATSGSGDRGDDNGVGTSDHWTWTIAGSRASSIPTVMTGEPQLTALNSAGGNWIVNMLPTAFPGGIRETQQHVIAGSPVPPPVQVQKMSNAFGYQPFGQISGMPIMDSNGTLTTKESKVFPIDAVQNRNVPNMMPAYQNMMPRGTVDCTWNLTLAP